MERKIIPYENLGGVDDGNIVVDGVSVTYSQGGDSEEGDGELLTVSTGNNGIARYIVLKTERWCISDVDELIGILEDFKQRAQLN